jgi:hypothetical protein
LQADPCAFIGTYYSCHDLYPAKLIKMLIGFPPGGNGAVAQPAIASTTTAGAGRFGNMA